jgi:ABC-type sugar transport system ATPase subunit
MPILELEGVHKAYAGVEVLDGIDLEAGEGEVLAIAGANGAGKTTLIKILSGAVELGAGEVRLDGRPVRLSTPRDAQELGIRTVYQELSLVPHLSVAENLLLGNLPKSGRLIDWPAVNARASALLERAGFRGIDVRQPASRLSVARQQMVEIAKALSSEPRILILDEPSAVLAGDDLERVFKLIRSLRERGTLVIYISHRLEEVMEIADRITVIRDGRIVATVTPDATDPTELVRLMAGTRLERVYPQRSGGTSGALLLEVEGLSRAGAFEDVSFSIERGEIVGMFGLVGSGRTEVARCLFGADPPTAGRVRIDGRDVDLRSPQEAIQAGVAFVTEDRARDGLVLKLPLRDNTLLASMTTARRFGLLSRRREEAIVDAQIKRLDIRPPRPEILARHLSGGNQQKVVLAKWLLTEPRLLILDEPTRGVDMATRVELYRMFDDLTADSIGVLLISSDLSEVLGVTDRILVMRDGRLQGEFQSTATSEEEVLACAVGVAA